MTLQRRLILIALAAILGCDRGRDEAGGEVDLSAYAATLGTRTGPIGMTDHQTLEWLTSTHRSEVEIGELARERALDEELKAFGNMLRVEHGRLVREGGMLERQLPPRNAEDSAAAPQLDSLAATHDSTMRALRAVSGEALDRLLAKTLVAVHAATLDTLQRWRGKALDPKLNTAMEKAAPILHRHLLTARKIDERLRKAAKARADSVKKAQKAKADSAARVQREKARADSARTARDSST
jgi:hypothetical protein